jgi:uncharacterized glyoxalase superfamily protein PhnB
MKILNISPELMVENMESTILWYSTFLEFKVVVKTPETNPFFAILQRDGFKILLYKREEFTKEFPKLKDKQIGGSFVIDINIKGIEKQYELVKDKVKVTQKLYNTDYGTKEFSIEDNSGYILLFSEDI